MIKNGSLTLEIKYSYFLEKAENRAIIEHAFFNNEISKSDYISEMNALELAEKTIKELDL